VQDKWLVKAKSHRLEVTADMEGNLANGGVCGIFELLHELKKEVRKSKYSKWLETLLGKLQPDFMSEANQKTQSNMLEFSILKIVNCVARKGKDLKDIFRQWDVDNNGFLDSQEIMRGVVFNLGIALSREESNLLTKYLDKDGDEKVSPQEFNDKISLKDYQQRSHRYTISSRLFGEKVLHLWYQIKAEVVDSIQAKIKHSGQSFDFE
jgi:Ca2+-binding EF-hand superfamily protein